MRNLTGNENIIIDVIIKFHILTGVFPTVDQLTAITGYSPKVIISMVMDGYLITEQSKYSDIIKFKKP